MPRWTSKDWRAQYSRKAELPFSPPPPSRYTILEDKPLPVSIQNTGSLSMCLSAAKQAEAVEYYDQHRFFISSGRGDILIVNPRYSPNNDTPRYAAFRMQRPVSTTHQPALSGALQELKNASVGL